LDRIGLPDSFSFRVGTCFREAKAFYTDFAATLFTKAVHYAVHEWEAVCCYVNNGQAEIDNNTAERLMKPICLGRKNYLFCGSEQAAKNASLIYSIIGSCKMNGLRLVKYIADVLRKLVSGDTDYMALLPMNIGK
jgi:transposase